ncbi:hypothetical protein OROMI_014269 [Orobanche minor]
MPDRVMEAESLHHFPASSRDKSHPSTAFDYMGRRRFRTSPACPLCRSALHFLSLRLRPTPPTLLWRASALTDRTLPRWFPTSPASLFGCRVLHFLSLCLHLTPPIPPRKTIVRLRRIVFVTHRSLRKKFVNRTGFF